jgi:hypothetical protein
MDRSENGFVKLGFWNWDFWFGSVVSICELSDRVEAAD